jgi:tRNA U34 5-carboxymethylaminomethyl modifying GTPase MnmE/TrmE
MPGINDTIRVKVDQDAHEALGRITGAVTAKDLLGVIFSRFRIK